MFCLSLVEEFLFCRWMSDKIGILNFALLSNVTKTGSEAWDSGRLWIGALLLALIRDGEYADATICDIDSFWYVSTYSSVDFVPISPVDMSCFLFSRGRGKPFLIRSVEEEDDDPGTDRLCWIFLCCLL